MSLLDPLLNTVHHANEHFIQPAWEQAEPLLQDLGLQALQSIDPQQVAQFVPDQTWQNVQNNLQTSMQTPDYSQPQAYEPAPSFEPAHSGLQTQSLGIEHSHFGLELHGAIGLRSGLDTNNYLSEANKALSDAVYHQDQATKYAHDASWYTSNSDKVMFGAENASRNASWADAEKEAADAKMKEASDALANAKPS